MTLRLDGHEVKKDQKSKMGLNDGVKYGQNGVKKGQKGSKRVSNGVKKGQKGFLMGSKKGQIGSKMVSNGVKKVKNGVKRWGQICFFMKNDIFV